MRFKIVVFLIFYWILVSCSAKKNVVKTTKKSTTNIDRIIAHAKSYKGVRYKFGGTTKKGMDCSGIVFVSFKKENILLPRVSRDMAKKGKEIPLKQAKKGDLLFFRTKKSRSSINHVGLIVSVKRNQVYFIHATTSKGVIISSLSEKYWKDAFVKATKVL